jgi:hypothetical protein
MKFPISFINHSTVVSDAEAKIVMGHLQTQVSRDFAPIWGVDAQLFFVSASGTPNPAYWQLVLLDDADAANALGYHELTSAGLPLGKVFVKTTAQAKGKWSVTASHELLEMLIDPDINLTVFVQDSNTSGRIYAYEVCDAVEDDSLGYNIYSATVSDFVTPAWFEAQGSSLSPKFDFMGHLTKPFALALNGYIGIFDATAGTGWQQLMGMQGKVGKFGENSKGGEEARNKTRTIGMQDRRRSKK